MWVMFDVGQASWRRKSERTATIIRREIPTRNPKTRVISQLYLLLTHYKIMVYSSRVTNKTVSL